MKARIEFYNDATFKGNAYFDSDYTNVFYADIAFSRSTADVFQEIAEDQLKGREITFQRKIQEQFFELYVTIPIWRFLSSMGMHDIIRIFFIDTLEVYNLTGQNVRVEDEGEPGDLVNKIRVLFDASTIAQTNCDDQEYELQSCP